MKKDEIKTEMELALKKARALKEIMETDGWQVVEEIARVLAEKNRFVDDIDLTKNPEEIREQITAKKMKVEALKEFFEALDRLIAEGENAVEALKEEKEED